MAYNPLSEAEKTFILHGVQVNQQFIDSSLPKFNEIFIFVLDLLMF